MSIEDKAQAEAKRLMAEVNQLQAKAKSQNVVKKAEAQKLVAEINRLQVAAIKDQDSEKARKAKAETKRLFEDQMLHVRNKQKNTREQLNRLMQAKQKYDLVQQSGKPTDAKLQQQLLVLIKKKKEEFVRLNQEAEAIRQQAQQKSVVLGSEADATERDKVVAKRQAENTNLTDRAKAEAEKLITEVNRPKRDAADKAEEVGKMIAEINRLQMAAEQGNLSDNEAEQLEDRINRIESKQREARDQINQLTQAKIKYELALARSSKEKNEEALRRAQDEKLQKELNTLIQKKESEQTQLMEELEVIRMRAEQEAALLKAQRDAARALAEQQAQAEGGEYTPGGSASSKWLVITLVVVILLAIGVGGFLVLPLLQQSNEPKREQREPPNTTAQVSETSQTKPTPSRPAPRTTPQVKALGEFSDRLRSGGRGPVMVKLPAGSFMMGSPPHLPYSEERPQFRATLNSFAISKYEITFADYEKFARSTGQRLPNDNGWGRSERPVVNISWDEADAYTRWLTLQTDSNYRLPTEREWEYAARAGTDTIYWWGNDISKTPPQANCGVCGSQWDGTQTAPVGQFPANAFGLHDVIGNVMEWTSSCHHHNYTDAPEFDNGWAWDKNTADCGRRMIRSSAFNTYKRDIRITRRQAFSLNSRSNNLGFRIVRVD